MRLLCVEDEAPLREDIAEYLRMKSYEVDEAETGEDAIEKLNQNQYDLVLCDIKMPRVNGFDLLRQMRSENSYAKTPFLFLSALNERNDKILANQTGCDGYLTKPVDFTVLDATIRGQIDRQRARDFVNISMLECTRKHVMATLDDAMNGSVAAATMVTHQLADGSLEQEQQKTLVAKLERYLSSHLQSLQQFYEALQFQTVSPTMQIGTESLELLIKEAIKEARGISPYTVVAYAAPVAASSLQVTGDLRLLQRAFAGLIALMPYDYPSNQVIRCHAEDDRLVITLCDMPSMAEDSGFMLIDGATDLVALSPVTRKRLIAITFAMQVAQAHRGWLELKINTEDELAVRFQLPHQRTI